MGGRHAAVTAGAGAGSVPRDVIVSSISDRVTAGGGRFLF